MKYPPVITKYIQLLNGVPIFFTLSGFLIYWSFDHYPNIRTYSKNRILRIYPALISALVCTVILLYIFNILTIEKMRSSGFFMWIFTQLTFIQEFTPSILSGFGIISNPNPVLWTIGVELQLYVTIPILYFCIHKLSRQKRTIIIVIIGGISYLQNQTCFISNFLTGLSDNGYWQIFIHPFNQLCSFYFFFCTGILVYLYKEQIIPFLSHKLHLLLPTYIFLGIIAYHFGYMPGTYHPKEMELIAYFILVATVFSAAYTRPELTNKLIGKTDISYGVYIYHMLIVQTFYKLGWCENIYILPLILIVFSVSWFSWHFIESPALKLKKHSLYKATLAKL